MIYNLPIGACTTCTNISGDTPYIDKECLTAVSQIQKAFFSSYVMYEKLSDITINIYIYKSNSIYLRNI